VGGLAIVGLLGENSRIPNGLGSEETPKTSSDAILMDKVYTFLAPYDSITCDGQSLKAQYNYEILMEIVTPHNCKINVTIIDPEQEVYDAFGTVYNASQGDGWFNFPFGTAIAGNYTFIFTVEAELNLNILLQVSYDNSEDGKCLYDVLDPQDKANLNLYNVTKFRDQEKIEHRVYLRTDYCHKFYIGRVSTIAENLPSIWGVDSDYDIDDPGGIPFIIYDNRSLPDVSSVAIFKFGTAVEGFYTVKIVIYCKVEVVNLAYAIVEDHKISTENPCNCTISEIVVPEPNNETDTGTNNGTTPQNYYYVPIEWTVGVAIVAGGAVGALIVVGFARKKRE